MGFFSLEKNKVSTDIEKIDSFLSRGVEMVYPSKEFLRSLLLKGEPLTIYLGIDPTGPTLHLGHSIVLKKLKEFQELGHKVVLLIGDFTGMIGDPTDKSATRKRLTSDEVKKNASVYKDQAGAFLSFSGPNKAVIKYNSEWLGKMNFEQVLELSSQMTVEQMLKRDMFESRIALGKPIFIHEFLYPLLQGYDSVAMEVDGEIGGNDQTFNMLVGRTLLKQIKNKEKFVITTKLLTDQEGKKMGKTEGNAVSFIDSPEEKYGKVMSWTDGMIVPGFELATFVSDNEINRIKSSIQKGENPKEIKMRLAREIVSIYHGKELAQKAEDSFKNIFKEGGVPEDVVEIALKKDESIPEALQKAGIVNSMSEWRRLVSEKAVEEVGGESVSDPHLKASNNVTLKIGKRRFVKIIVN